MGKDDLSSLCYAGLVKVKGQSGVQPSLQPHHDRLTAHSVRVGMCVSAQVHGRTPAVRSSRVRPHCRILSGMADDELRVGDGYSANVHPRDGCVTETMEYQEWVVQLDAVEMLTECAGEVLRWVRFAGGIPWTVREKIGHPHGANELYVVEEADVQQGLRKRY